jgi:hypothetical protein
MLVGFEGLNKRGGGGGGGGGISVLGIVIVISSSGRDESGGRGSSEGRDVWSIVGAQRKVYVGFRDGTVIQSPDC